MNRLSKNGSGPGSVAWAVRRQSSLWQESCLICSTPYSLEVFSIRRRYRPVKQLDPILSFYSCHAFGMVGFCLLIAVPFSRKTVPMTPRWLKYSLAFQQKWLKSILAFTVDGFHKLPFEMLQTDFLSRDAAVSIYERNQMIFQVLIGHILSEINTIQVINQPCPIITICFTTANNAISEVKQVLNT